VVEGVITSCCKALEDWVIRRVTVVKTNKAKGMIKDRISRCHSSQAPYCQLVVQGSQVFNRILEDVRKLVNVEPVEGTRCRRETITKDSGGVVTKLL